LPAPLPHLNLNAAAIDIGSTAHFVTVPEGRDTVSVREFATFTADLTGWPTGSHSAASIRW
jgi:hypothetical protein